MNPAKALFQALVSGNKESVNAAFKAAMNDKVTTELKVRKIAVASKIFSSDK